MFASSSQAFDFMKQAQDAMGAIGGAGGNSTSTATTAASLSNTDMVAGLKDALRVGSERVVAQLGAVDGFNADAAIHIPLPESMKTAKSALSAIGMQGSMDELARQICSRPPCNYFWSF
ncbi:MAG: hypothetical protein CO186_09875 [Zetaproteobacteria bacterium CG_4_9_14_3_um_filter_49_83]|nr:MAG: hypothetical protein AUJ56_11465 [Zetaproteobacteria bacterium CG1_02_49_23]PIQ32311.1 MAG: hypothetical protein COW62_08025 [Zetaproteobacteria bacterium CG17_big_fil_post_rev_8_21_14_2_50_50_13]PIY56997.1 MAG: hypothetical protein COZ00_01440 [Zetaproteobacteria bacterium CG_4_10_14_0_8_um_filter_49_80]PJA34664.1 MAG: hypothetical protein CO186_09875 [Zetaproteobacteria bacterium CG_4_9_14_3_um_filter_49_83]